MKFRYLFTACCIAILSGVAGAQPAGMPPFGDDAPIFGSQIMSQEERIEHRNRMRSAKTLEEREQIRQEHHQQMLTRAKERGVVLPDEPPMRRGQGMGGPGMRPGGGMGPAGGLGPMR